MLVLSRREGESIVIDGNILVTVLKTNGKVTSLGIEAPKEVPIRRSELDRSTDSPSQVGDKVHRSPEAGEFVEFGALI